MQVDLYWGILIALFVAPIFVGIGAARALSPLSEVSGYVSPRRRRSVAALSTCFGVAVAAVVAFPFHQMLRSWSGGTPVALAGAAIVGSAAGGLLYSWRVRVDPNSLTALAESAPRSVSWSPIDSWLSLGVAVGAAVLGGSEALVHPDASSLVAIGAGLATGILCALFATQVRQAAIRQRKPFRHSTGWLIVLIVLVLGPAPVTLALLGAKNCHAYAAFWIWFLPFSLVSRTVLDRRGAA